jgi:hypothetical protein
LTSSSNDTRRRNPANLEGLLGFALFVGLAVLASRSPVQNDTWWHLRYGEQMALQGGFADTDTFSFTAAGRPFPNHEWLGERVLYEAFRLGGLPAVTGMCGLLIAVSWWLIWRLMRGPLADRLLTFSVALASATTIWSIRPQVFTTASMSVTAALLCRGILWPIPLVFLLWANLHGGAVIGLVLIAVAAVTEGTTGRRQLPARHIILLVLCLAATWVTPLGIHYLPEISKSIMRSRENGLIEWRPPDLSLTFLPFWCGAIGFLVAFVRRWRHLRTAAARFLVSSAGLLLISAMRAMRNIPLFAMLAAPAFSRLLVAESSEDENAAAPHSLRHVGAFEAALGAILILLGTSIVLYGWSTAQSAMGWTPMSESAAAAINVCRPPIYNRYGDGGVLIWFARGQKVFLDSRQDPFPVALVQAASAVESGGDYHALFAEWHINCAVLPPASPTVRRLVADGWTTRFADSQWIVVERPRPAPTEATASQAP